MRQDPIARAGRTRSAGAAADPARSAEREFRPGLRRPDLARARSFVVAEARRLAASMVLPAAVDVDDLIRDGMLGLLDAAAQFDAARGVAFETFAARRVRGAMIDGLRRVSAARSFLRRRRRIEAARQALRLELGGEPSTADLARRLGTDAASLRRTIHRINVLEATHPLATADTAAGVDLPPVLKPTPPTPPDRVCEAARRRAAVAALPRRERRVIGRLYWRGDARRAIGLDLGVSVPRVDQIRAQALRRLRAAAGLPVEGAR